MEWTNITVTLSQLEPWGDNPKSISRASAKRLLDYWQRIGQFQTIAIGPENDSGKNPVYDGHQRLHVLKAAHGGKFTIDARVSERPLTEDERAEMVLQTHAGTTGQWDWDMLAAWDGEKLKSWGMDSELLGQWTQDTEALFELVASGVDVENDKLIEEEMGIRPREMFRVLISVPLDAALDTKAHVEKIGKIKEAEIVYGAN